MNWSKQILFQVAFGLGILLLLFVHNGSISLWDQDEAAYAGFGFQMLKTGKYLIPEFFWSEVHRKTPLLFWEIAALFRLFGLNEFALRLPNALSVLTTIIAVFFFSKEIFDKQKAFVIAAVLATSFLVVVLAKIAVTDAGVLMYCTLCAISLYFILQKTSNWWVFLFWISFALGLLQKGPPVVIFSLVFFIALAVFHADRKALLFLKPWFGLPLAILPFLYWLNLTYQSESGADFISWFVDWYILKRINSSVFGQTGPPGTHLIFMALSFLPYFMFFPQALWVGMHDLFKRKDPNAIFFGCWLVAGWLFYEISPSKLPTYVIAAHIPVAFLIGNKMVDLSAAKFNPKKVFVLLQYLLLGLISVAIFVLPFILKFGIEFKILFAISASVLILFLFLSYYFGYRQRNILWLLGFGLALQLIVWVVLMPKVDKLKDATKQVAIYLKSELPENAIVIIGNDFGRPPSLPFYLMQHFDDVREQKDLELLWSLYNSMQQGALILNKEQYDFFKIRNQAIICRQFSSFLTDRKERSDYYVVVQY